MELQQFLEIPPEVGVKILRTNGLTYREQETVKMLLGLNDGFVYTHAQIAEVYRATAADVKEWENSAAEKLKDVAL